MKVDYLKMAQEYFGKRRDGCLTDTPYDAPCDGIKVRYDSEKMEWIPSRPSRIKYPTARKLINQYRKKYAEKWG